MARRSTIVIAATFLFVLVAPAIPAAAGGGCHRGVTQGEGDTVELVEACFSPTTLRIQPGDAVTFVNRDAMIHNVGGNLWGHFDDLNPGDRFTATFDEAGIYPFACSYHPGMTGAVVVGEGLGVGNGETVAVASSSGPEPSPVVRVRTVQASSAPVATGWVAGSVIGLGLGLGIGLMIRRRTRPAA